MSANRFLSSFLKFSKACNSLFISFMRGYHTVALTSLGTANWALVFEN